MKVIDGIGGIMTDRSPVFEETYLHYLNKIADLDLETVARRVGGDFNGHDISLTAH